MLPSSRTSCSDGEQIPSATHTGATAAHTQKKTRDATERATEEGQKPRRVSQEKISDLDGPDLVCVDATGVKTARTRLEARAPKGARASASAPGNQGKKVTGVGA